MAPSTKLLLLGLVVVACLVAAYLVLRPKSYPVTSISAAASPTPLGSWFEMIVTVPSGLALPGLIGKKATFSYTPSGSSSPFTFASTVTQIWTAASGWLGSGNGDTTLALPSAGSAIVQFGSAGPVAADTNGVLPAGVTKGLATPGAKLTF